MKILGIESSCDDTSVALIEASENNFVVLAEKTASQIDIHKKYGGVVPEIAGREHAIAIMPVIEEVLSLGYTRDAMQKKPFDFPRLRSGQVAHGKPDAIAVTAGPGLITGLVIGVEAAKNLSYLWEVPLIRVNHMDGHVHSVLLKNQINKSGANIKIENQSIEFPALCLLVSGGHTELLLATDHGVYEKLGATRDDAAGECFDKVAKLLGLEYPGGPKISALAKKGNANTISFPRPMIKENNLDFSFAGLKTAALYWLRDNELSALDVNPDLPAGIFGVQHNNPTRADFCTSFEQAIVDVIVEKTSRAAEKYQPTTIIFGGGVSANEKMRATLRAELQKILPNSKFLIPEKKYSMDNGAMIAVAGYFQAQKNNFTSWRDIVVDPNWEAYISG
ncbi:MAG: hypothetical protein A2821_02565 [Candidatus Magasanikbacteria bacterium RIFCSPHIGHO2_01_FULL_41_23]|uniref:tRNA N6-adenosine threonylcarbamoyltransferase n=1 Tax=Candidatus Magasanikbacteria bacterium RIFCSPLOWO2_01_FULL_40_15 TaxID=1798686 RepID=A0A1F6N2J3_9BACT|nr:MAG: hypothetical protein A2821_02565 [Candidatus Magasanikbacteria bacterium RIFCSPHIGHO2_01_FULL_41_23]OGH66891.1 MAG: hypothetical protein A3C66_02345 [Candidatus Magasanikbacteria bacterium RIFCSPHIGHO2_02_FULL_41_35]OGH74875.1 MAG: hypothetical protein A3F22_04275 [Candidatus Magasanikbacteria bacterium RIFCSPHIGHO2_12_FULL_41_16]OGH78149.1 MAG: hypothetical protein A2983_03690 [Candidatus Magasanikbacteria bacterium RIFCSPLOWO2_01_FULL_40_15]